MANTNFQANRERGTVQLIIMAAKQQLTPPEFICRTGKKPKNEQCQQHYLIQSLPGVGPTIANSLLMYFGTIEQIILADALSKVMLNGFHALMIVDPDICKPFDKNRRGLNIGEGAAFLVLESERVAKRKQVIAELTGYGNSNDAYHLTALSPDGEGTAQAMKQAIKEGGLEASAIDYINAHGTGSENSDLSEALGFLKVFKETTPLFSSTKPFTGHTLGSAGALEAVFSVLSIRDNLIFPNLNFSQKMEETGLIPHTKPTTIKQVNHVLSNSFGFGGNNTSLLFSKVTE